jgi:ABC-type sugar transport system substrate-binding protein
VKRARRLLRRRPASGPLILALALIVLLVPGCDPLDSAELRREVDSIGSVAAEGQLLASDVALDRTKATFVRVHAGELSSAAEDSAQKLNDADVATGLEDDTKQAIEIANEASDALGTLVVSPGDEQLARSAVAKLRDAGDRADRLSASL